MINNNLASPAGLGSGYLNASTVNGFNTVANYYTMGMYGQIMDGVMDIDDASGNMLSYAQDAYLYPSKVLTEAMIGNTEAGKQWIDFVASNVTLSGHKRRRDYEAKMRREQPNVKRREVDFNSGGIPSREVDVNTKMKQRSGKIFQAPQGFTQMAARAVGKVGGASSAAQRLKEIAAMYQTLSSY